MEIKILPSISTGAEAAASEIAAQIRRKPGSVLGLATGNTTTPLHEALVRLAKGGEVDFSKVFTFNLDEYIGLPRSHPESCYARTMDQLFQHLPIQPANIHIPNIEAPDLELACASYENEIQASGGIDVQVLGIGLNGHIGFNEPGTPFDSLTHVAKIAKQTREAKAHLFADLDSCPQRGITIGIGTILRARTILLLAFGGGKAGIVKQALYGVPTPNVPASAVQLHSNVLVILDEAAASELETA